MDKVLVTGGTGFCGFWMQQTQPKNIQAMYMDSRIYRMGGWPVPDYIVHLANIEPASVAHFALKCNARLLYCSSGIVYHPENDTEYRRNKIVWEQQALQSGADVVIARLFTFYGERLDDNKAVVQFEKSAKAGKPLRIWGDGSCIRSYMHGSELGRWMWAILLKGKRGEAYDVGDDRPVTMLELAKLHSENIIIEGGIDPMPVYLPPNTDKTKALLKE